MSFILSVSNKPECRYAECRYSECRYSECRYAECRGTALVSGFTLTPQKVFLMTDPAFCKVLIDLQLWLKMLAIGKHTSLSPNPLALVVVYQWPVL